MKDILFHIDSYPEPTPAEAIDQAVGFAAAVGGSLTALAVQVNLSAPSNWLADRLINLSGMCAEQEATSLAACREATRLVGEKLAANNMGGGSLLTKADLNLSGNMWLCTRALGTSASSQW